jgi:hypothetical protein
VSLASGEVSRSVEVDVPYLLYSRADQITDGADGAIELQVAQLGTYGSSRPAALHFNI